MKIEGATALVSIRERPSMYPLIAAAIVVFFVLLTLWRTVKIVPQARAGVVERLGRYSRTLSPRPDTRRSVRRPDPRHDRPARAGRLLPAAAGDHRGQPRREHRHGHLLPGDRSEGGDVRDRELHPGDRAAHGHNAPQRDRGDCAGEDAHLARSSMRSCASCSTRRPASGGSASARRAEGGRPAASIQDSMEKQMRADREKRATILAAEDKQASILTAEGEKPAAILRAEGERRVDDPRGRRAGEGDRHRLQGDPRGQAGPAAARVRVPPDAPADRAGRGEQGLDRADRVPHAAIGRIGGVLGGGSNEEPPDSQ